MMNALSIRQPWCWAILHAGKDVENRNWRTIFRGRFAIHAAKGMTRDEYQNGVAYITQAFIRNAIRHPVTRIREHDGLRVKVSAGQLVLPELEEIVRGAIIGVAEVVGCVTKSDSEWFEGKFGF